MSFYNINNGNVKIDFDLSWFYFLAGITFFRATNQILLFYISNLKKPQAINKNESTDFSSDDRRSEMSIFCWKSVIYCVVLPRAFNQIPSILLTQTMGRIKSRNGIEVNRCGNIRFACCFRCFIPYITNWLARKSEMIKKYIWKMPNHVNPIRSQATSKQEFRFVSDETFRFGYDLVRSSSM